MGIAIAGTVFIACHSNIVDDTICKGGYIDAVGSHQALAAGIGGFLIFHLGQAIYVIGNYTRAHANSAATGAHYIAYDANDIGIVVSRDIHSAARGDSVYLYILVILILFSYLFNFFARSKADIVVHKGFGVRIAAHVGHHAC